MNEGNKKGGAIKKVLIALAIVIPVVLICVGIFFVINKKTKDASEGVCYVEKVSSITGGGVTWQNRYMGIVESQEVTKVQKDSDKTVKEIFVKEEDIVKEGDKLFQYDTEEMNLKLQQLQLELTSIYNNINTMYDQIETLSTERDEAPAENKIEYTSQIQNLQAQINQASYDASAKQLEIDRQSAAITNSVVYAPVGGVISKINNQESSGNDYSYDMYGMNGSENDGFISIMAMGDYRIKGTVSELNAYELYEGMSVILRSRMDENMMWTGYISKIDLEHPEENDYMYYYSPGEIATKYPFYVQVDSSEGLMLGQHLYIELDYGQGMVKDGIWLYEGYLLIESNGTFIWKETDGKLEKVKIEIGEYDSDMMEYEVLSGISESDYIAYPEDRLLEGMKTTHNYEDVMLEDDVYQDGGFMDMDGDIYLDDVGDDIYMDDGMDGDVYFDDMGDDAYMEDGVDGEVYMDGEDFSDVIDQDFSTVEE